VTKAFTAKFYAALWLCEIQKKTIEKLQEELSQKK